MQSNVHMAELRPCSKAHKYRMSMFITRAIILFVAVCTWFVPPPV